MVFHIGVGCWTCTPSTDLNDGLLWSIKHLCMLRDMVTIQLFYFCAWPAFKAQHGNEHLTGFAGVSKSL